MTVYPATWNVTGQGFHDRTRGTTRRVAQWTVTDPAASGPAGAAIGFTLQPVGGGLDVARRNAQLTKGGGYIGPDQFINAGVPQAPTRLAATLYEWNFPKIVSTAVQTQLTGSNSTEVKTSLGPLQPSDAVSTVNCAWALGRGAAPPLPPPTMTRTSPPGSVAQGGSAPATNPPTAAATSGSPAATVATTAPAGASSLGGAGSEGMTPGAAQPTSAGPGRTTPSLPGGGVITKSAPTGTAPAGEQPASTQPLAPPVTTVVDTYEPNDTPLQAKDVGTVTIRGPAVNVASMFGTSNDVDDYYLITVQDDGLNKSTRDVAYGLHQLTVTGSFTRSNPNDWPLYQITATSQERVPVSRTSKAEWGPKVDVTWNITKGDDGKLFLIHVRRVSFVPGESYTITISATTLVAP